MFRRLLLAVLGTALLASPAAAAKLGTTEIGHGKGSDLLCAVSNLSGQTLQVNLSIVRTDGTLEATVGYALAAGKSANVHGDMNDIYSGRCQIDVNAPKTAVRAALLLYVPGAPVPVVIEAH